MFGFFLSLCLFAAPALSSAQGADCNETPVSLNQLGSILTSPKTNDIADVMKALPAGSFGPYTFVTNSLSGQKGTGETGVSPTWPRVIRSNKDGSITFSWTCNPKSETYGDVEMLYYSEGELKARTYKLNRPAGSTGANQRVDTSCTTCHSTGVPIASSSAS